MATPNEWDLDDDGSDAQRRRRKSEVRPLVSAALVARVQNGSVAAFRTLVELFEDRVFAHALALSGDVDAARAAAREVFVRAHAEVKALTDAKQVPAMLRRLVQRDSPPRDELRGRSATSGVSTGPSASAEIATTGAATRDAMGTEGRGFLGRVLDLTFEERAVALLALAADATEAETSAMLGVPAPTVSSRLAIAKKRVKQRTWRGVQEELVEARPSASAAFADEVLARVARA